MANQRDDAPEGDPAPDAESAPESPPSEERATWLDALLSKIEGREDGPPVPAPEDPEDHPTDVQTHLDPAADADAEIEVDLDFTDGAEHDEEIVIEDVDDAFVIEARSVDADDAPALRASPPPLPRARTAETGAATAADEPEGDEFDALTRPGDYDAVTKVGPYVGGVEDAETDEPAAGDAGPHEVLAALGAPDDAELDDDEGTRKVRRAEVGDLPLPGGGDAPAIAAMADEPAVVEQQLAPVDEQQPAGVDEEEPTVDVAEEPAVVDEQEPAVVEEEEPAAVAEQEPAVVEEEEDLLAAAAADGPLLGSSMPTVAAADLLDEPPPALDVHGDGAYLDAVGEPGAQAHAGQPPAAADTPDEEDEVTAISARAPIAEAGHEPALSAPPSDEVTLPAVETDELDVATAVQPPRSVVLETPFVDAETRDVEVPPSHDAPPDERRAAPPAPSAALQPLERALEVARAADAGGVETALQAELDAAQRPLDRAALCFELGRLRRSRRGDVTGALQAWSDALRHVGGFRPAVWATRGELVADEAWAKVSKLLEEQQHAEEAPRQKAEILLERGWIAEDRLQDLGQARDCYWAAHVADKGWLAPLLALERLLRGQGDVAGLVDTYARMADAATEDALKVSALRDLARAELLASGAVPRALAALQRAAELAAPEAARAVRYQMDLVAAQAGLHEQRIEILEAMASDLTEEAPVRAACLRQAAQICRFALKQPVRAQTLVARALELCPEDPVLHQDRLAIAEQAGDWSTVAALLRAQCDAQPDDEERAAMLHTMSIAHLRAGETAAAALTMDEALTVLPGYLPVLVDRERRALAAGDVTALARTLADEARALARCERGVPPAAAQEEGWRALTWWRSAVAQRAVGDKAQAIEDCRNALTAAPELALARRELVSLLWEEGRHRELADAAEAQLRTASADEACWLLETLIALYSGPLEDLARLVDALQQLRDRDPEDRRILCRLADAYERAGRHEELAAALEQLERLDVAGSAVEGLKLRRAALCAGPLGRPEEAIALYKEILEDAPGQPYAFSAVEALLRREGQHAELAELIRKAAARTDAAEQRAQLLAKLGWVLATELRDPQQAFDTYRELLDLDPGHPTAPHDLLRCARATNDPRRVAEALEVQIARGGGDDDHLARLSLRLGEVLRYGVGESERAEECFQRAAAAATPELAAAALDLLAQRQLGRGDLAQAGETLERLEELAPPELRAALLSERAYLAEGPLATPDEAGKLHEELARLTPESMQLTWSRARSAVRERDPLALSAASLELAAGDAPQSAAAALCARAGTLAAAAGDESAATALRRALATAPDNLEAILGLLGLPEVEPGERADLLTQLEGMLPDTAREQLRLELAEACLAAGRPAAAAARLRELLAGDPDNIAALSALQRVARAAGDQIQEARIWIKLATLISEPRAKAEALGRGGRLLEAVGRKQAEQSVSRQQLLCEAAEVYRCVLPLRPHDMPVFDRLRKLCEETGDDQGLEQLLSHRIEHTDDRLQLIPLLFERADLRLHKLADTRSGARDLLRVLELDPKHIEALRQLAELYDQDGDAERAMQLYHRFAAATESLSMKRTPTLRLADLLARHDRVFDAIEACRRFLDLVPEDDTVLERLAELYVQAKDYVHAVQTLEKLGALRNETAWRVQNMRRVAQIYWREMRCFHDARATLLSSLDVDPTDLETLDDLRKLSRDMDLPPEDLHQLMARAKEDLGEALAAAPLHVDLYRRLMRVAEWDEDEHTLLAALGVLCYLNAAEAQDRDLYRRRAEVLSFEPKRNLQAQAWREALVSGAARSAYGEIWAAIAAAVPRLYPDRIPSDARAFGLARGDRVSRKAGGPVSSTVDRIASAFGMAEFEIYLSSRDPEIVAGIAGDRDALIIGHGVVSAMDAAQRFRVGRTLSLLRDRAFAVEVLKGDEIALLLGAAVYLVEPGATLNVPRAEVEAASKRLAKAMSRAARKALPLAVTRFLHEGGDVDEWINGVLATANRAGLLVCGDVLTAMDQLEGLPRGDERARKSTQALIAALRESPQATQLLLYSISGQYLALRRELQL